MTRTYSIDLYDRDLLVDLAEILQRCQDPTTEVNALPEIMGHFAFLERIALQDNCVYSLFDFNAYRYLFHTKTLFSLIGLNPGITSPRWDSSYVAMLTDRKPIHQFLFLRKQFVSRFKLSDYRAVQFVACGCYSTNLEGKQLRGFYRSRPLTYDAAGDVAVAFDCVSDVKPLMVTERGYWIRLSADEHICYWHSNTGKLIMKDIISPREIELIMLWRSGLSIPEIADRVCISTFTVKNQLANARQRMLARDNSSLVLLCTLIGILPPTF
ncbi:response regulator transcription factor [Olivibacter sitiensis]|uniref:response regulator transcription factor n=1 Tax=Olivibacter sitiensis TaxID=376470 RepID=UPI00040CBA7F|nr:helix-turn-helix transcriptional regulator [Olivibacter sitiensis]